MFLDHMAPCLPPPLHLPSQKKHCCITIVFDFSWDDCNTQERLETMVIQLLGGGGVDKVYYGLCENGQFFCV